MRIDGLTMGLVPSGEVKINKALEALEKTVIDLEDGIALSKNEQSMLEEKVAEAKEKYNKIRTDADSKSHIITKNIEKATRVKENFSKMLGL